MANIIAFIIYTIEESVIIALSTIVDGKIIRKKLCTKDLLKGDKGHHHHRGISTYNHMNFIKQICWHRMHRVCTQFTV